MCLDGNGGWHSKHTKHKSVAGTDNSVECYYFRYFVHNVATIKKVVGYLVHSKESTTLSADSVLIQHYWRGSDGEPKFLEEFPTEAERRGENGTASDTADAAQQHVRGRALTPTVIFHKVMDSVSLEDRLFNPYMIADKLRQQNKLRKETFSEMTICPS